MKRRIVVLGTMAGDPYAGMAWMHMQLTAGLHRLGHDVLYMETTSNWPYDPVREQKVADSEYSVAYLEQVARQFGLADRWAYRRSYSDGEWLGPLGSKAAGALREADVVLNVAGATRLEEHGLTARNLVYLGTDPVYDEVTYAAGDAGTRAFVDEHVAVATYGENIGTPASPIPPLPNLRAWTRQPVLIDLWEAGPPTRDCYTTVANWKQDGPEVELHGVRYLWSKDQEFMRVLEVPRRAGIELELATNLAPPDSMRYGGEGEPVKTRGVDEQERALLQHNGWALVDARPLTTSPWPYRDYVKSSRGEITVARDLNVRLRSGWFSERSACYLAAGRPVVTQDTGFGTVIPTGEGLFAFSTPDEAVGAIEEIERDYEHHSRAAREIAEEYFRAERVLSKLLDDLGV